ncbi:hypothetical protein [Aquiflexum sp.]|uniref:hypothetical protein n=1 Tax=Aquiflexum sp. TaxID=1872584 RepID=UPI003593B2CE
MKKLVTWLYAGRYIFYFISILIAVRFISQINVGLNPIDNIKIYGLALQIFGALTIINSLKQKLILFKGHGLIKLFTDWFRAFPFFRKKRTYNMSGNITLPSLKTTGEMKTTKRPNDKDIKDVIMYFDDEIQFLTKNINKTKTELKENISKVINDLDLVNNSLNEKISETRQKIIDTSVSNVWLDLFGVSSIIIGLIYSTIPELIFKIVN